MARELPAIKLETFIQLDNTGRTRGINGNLRRDTVTLIYDKTSFPRELSTSRTVWTKIQ